MYMEHEWSACGPITACSYSSIEQSHHAKTQWDKKHVKGNHHMGENPPKELYRYDSLAAYVAVIHSPEYIPTFIWLASFICHLFNMHTLHEGTERCGLLSRLCTVLLPALCPCESAVCMGHQLNPCAEPCHRTRATACALLQSFVSTAVHTTDVQRR